MSEGLVAVAFAESEGEAMVIRGLLESSGIPAIVEPGGYAPKGLDAGIGSRELGGGKRVVVHAERAAEARLLLDADEPEPPGLS